MASGQQGEAARLWHEWRRQDRRWRCVPIFVRARPPRHAASLHAPVGVTTRATLEHARRRQTSRALLAERREQLIPFSQEGELCQGDLSRVVSGHAASDAMPRVLAQQVKSVLPVGFVCRFERRSLALSRSHPKRALQANCSTRTILRALCRTLRRSSHRLGGKLR